MEKDYYFLNNFEYKKKVTSMSYEYLTNLELEEEIPWLRSI